MKLITRNLLIGAVAVTIANLISAPAQAAQTCSVATRDRSNLSIYDGPNTGNLINELRWGRKVDIKDSTKDSEGRLWVKIAGNYNGEYRQWGWVIRQYLECGPVASAAKKIVTVYGRMSCGNTQNMIQQLTQNGIPYLFKDIDQAEGSREAGRLLEKSNVRLQTLPLVYINKNQWVKANPHPSSVISQYRNS
jgi:hypothetical protein